MISYAQNQEDVVLHRLTRLVETGRFIDVGAAHPILENVTYALYLEGWRGVNVEPMEREFQLLSEIRNEDENIHAAVGRESGVITLYEAPLENRGATTFDAATVERYRSAGQTFGEFESKVVTLHSILEKFPSGSVHIVKIDVEGLEKDVLLGANLALHQPWVLVVEATRPNSQVDSSHEWESIVLDAGYEVVLFDGLNKFYVRNDLDAVKALLAVPANVFDNWQSHQNMTAVDYAKSLEEVLTARGIEISNAKVEIDSLREHLENVQHQAQLVMTEREEQRVYIEALLQMIDRIKA